MFDTQFAGSLIDSLEIYHFDNEFNLLNGFSISGGAWDFLIPANIKFTGDDFFFNSIIIKDQDFNSLSTIITIFDIKQESILTYLKKGQRGFFFEPYQNSSLFADVGEGFIDLYLIQDGNFINSFALEYDVQDEFVVSDVHFLDENRVVILAHGPQFNSIIFIHDFSKDSSKCKIIENCFLTEIIESHNSILVCSGFTEKFEKETENKSDGLIIELDDELDIRKSVLVHADNFRCKEIKIVPISNQEYLLAYSTFTGYPVIFSIVDSDFRLLSQRGYDFRRPDIFIGNNDDLFVFSGQANNQYVLTKTKLNSSLNDCPEYAACLQLSEVEFTAEEIQLTSSEIDSLDTIQLDWTHTSIGFSPYECPDNSLPSAIFSMPDTVCHGECIIATNTDNLNAQQIEWNLESPSEVLNFKDSTTLELCFNEFGSHNLEQKIWVLGCEYSFDKNIIVIDKPMVQLEDQVLCDEDSVVEIFTENDNLTLLWSDGLEGLERSFLASGYYETTVSNGFCDTIIGANIGFEKTNLEEILLLPNDTIICAQKFPFEFSIPNFMNDGIFLEGTSINPDDISISQEGTYVFKTVINGCNYEKELLVGVDSCLANIYLPTAFSPNADGINDVFEPLGKNFEVIDLEIYNRWGALLCKKKSYWNGTLNGENLNSDVFFYILTYKNTITNEVKNKTGTVSLIK